MTRFLVEPVGRVRGGRATPLDDDWADNRSVIELDPSRFTPEALAGLDAFSHAEVVFLFDRIDESAIETGARRPRGRADWPMTGIFAQRGSGRPNRIGVSVCSIGKVDGLTLEVVGLDAVDGTPVLDIKPVLKGFLPRGEVREPAWAQAIMSEYW